MIRACLIIIFTIYLSSLSFCQPNKNWHFGNGAALQFTSNSPVIVSGSQINTGEGCSTISDASGNLLFYTDGVTVWDKNSNIMFNGTGLKGGSSSSQSSIIVPAPGNVNKYYVFTSVQVEANSDTRRDYCYNLIDMGLRGGLGEVVQKNIVFDTACSERLTAANNANGTDFWIITNTVNTNIFKVFALSSNGLSDTPVVSTVGDTVLAGIGMCKVSPDGKWMIQTFRRNQNLASAQLFSFNTKNGQISNPIRLNNVFECTYGCAFSSNSNRLYLSGGFNCAGNPRSTFVQYTLEDTSELAILKSGSTFSVNQASSSVIGDLSTGLDDKLYISVVGRRLSCFENPNDTATNLIFKDTALLFPNRTLVTLGLPNYYNTINLPPSVLKSDRLTCLTYKFSFPAKANYAFRGIYTWDFGDGSPLNNDSIPIHTFSRKANDSFLVKLNFKSKDNLVSVNEETWIKLLPKPIANFTLNSNACVNDTVRFANLSNSPSGKITNYNWHFGDGTSSVNIDPIKKYNDTGRYTITLSVTDTFGCISDTSSVSTIFDKKVIANFQLKGAYCVGSPLTLIDSTTTINTKTNNWIYSWNEGNTYTSTISGNFAPTYNKEGLYTIHLVAKTAEGCKSDTITKTYFIYNTPKAGFSLPKNCVLDTSRFINSSSLNGASIIDMYKWNFGVNEVLSDTSFLQNPTYQYAKAASYPVKLSVVSNQGCIDSLTQIFTVNGAVPNAKISFAVNPICSGDSIVLLNQSTVNFGTITKMDIFWGTNTFIDSNPTQNNSYKYKFREFGVPASLIQPIKITAYSGINCNSTLDTFITLKAQPSVNFVLPIDSICGNSLPISLTQGIENSGANGFGRYVGSGVIQSATNSYEFNPSATLPNSLATIQYVFSTPDGCSDTVSKSINVLPFPKANAGGNRILIKGESIILNASSFGSNLRFSWSPASLASNPTLLRTSIKSNVDTTMLLTVTNTFGCLDTSSMRIDVVDPVTPPNAFSPNFDGINDTWVIPNIAFYPNCDVSIYNRVGQLMFKSKGYGRPWNGTINGNPVPIGTYYYIINLSNDKDLLSGWVQVFR